MVALQVFVYHIGSMVFSSLIEKEQNFRAPLMEGATHAKAASVDFGGSVWIALSLVSMVALPLYD